MTRTQKIVDKVRKLRKLAESPNPHEAATAAAMADRLVREYGLDEAEPEPLRSVGRGIFIDPKHEQERQRMQDLLRLVRVQPADVSRPAPIKLGRFHFVEEPKPAAAKRKAKR